MSEWTPSSNLVISDPQMHRFNTQAAMMINEADGSNDKLRAKGWNVIQMPDPGQVFLCDFCNTEMETRDELGVPISVQCIGSSNAICGECVDNINDGEHGPIDNLFFCPCCTGTDYINHYLVEINARYKA